MKLIRNFSPSVLALALLISVVSAAAADTSVAVGPSWPSYLGSSRHQSLSSESVITPANAAGLKAIWHWSPPPSAPGQPKANVLYASPIVVDSRVFMGTNSGVLYALSEVDGSVLWSRDLGHSPHYTCSKLGLISTPTVASDPSRSGRSTLYVGGGDGYLYALDPTDGSVIWRTLMLDPLNSQNGNFNWASPAVANGEIYMGLSSQCDDPFTPGGVREVDQATGAIVHTWWSMPPQDVGAGVWSSPSVSADGSRVFATTGSTYAPPYPQGESYSIARLDGATMNEVSHWTIPASSLPCCDSDFGATPVLFQADVGAVSTGMVAACNKNGYLSAFRQNDIAAGPLWSRKIDAPKQSKCLGSAVFDGTSLYQGGAITIIGGVKYAGSIRRLAPATGKTVWQVGLAGQVVGTPALDSAGILAVQTMDFGAAAQNGVYLIDSVTGDIIAKLGADAAATDFAQPAFADGRLFVAYIGEGLIAYAP